MIDDITRVAEVGQVYDATVVRLEKFGAFVELFKGTDALLHVSKIRHERVDKPEDVLKIGDKIKVKVTEIDEKGRVNCSAKDLLPKLDKEEMDVYVGNIRKFQAVPGANKESYAVRVTSVLREEE